MQKTGVHVINLVVVQDADAIGCLVEPWTGLCALTNNKRRTRRTRAPVTRRQNGGRFKMFTYTPPLFFGQWKVQRKKEVNTKSKQDDCLHRFWTNAVTSFGFVIGFRVFYTQLVRGRHDMFT